MIEPRSTIAAIGAEKTKVSGVVVVHVARASSTIVTDLVVGPLASVRALHGTVRIEQLGALCGATRALAINRQRPGCQLS